MDSGFCGLTTLIEAATNISQSEVRSNSGESNSPTGVLSLDQQQKKKKNENLKNKAVVHEDVPLESIINTPEHSQGPPPPPPPSTEEITTVNENDVLCGRGGETNHHPGNVRYRKLVKSHQRAYLNAKRRDKPRIARVIVDTIRRQSPPGRFLKKDSNNGTWRDVGNVKAREKTSQALREGAPEIRDSFSAGSTLKKTTAAQSQRMSVAAHEKAVTVTPPFVGNGCINDTDAMVAASPMGPQDLHPYLALPYMPGTIHIGPRVVSDSASAGSSEESEQDHRPVMQEYADAPAAVAFSAPHRLSLKRKISSEITRDVSPDQPVRRTSKGPRLKVMKDRMGEIESVSTQTLTPTLTTVQNQTSAMCPA
eukprot:CAMPEP_0178954652 /NCGR_PEP_ID=MMETSP0789-20121207/9120_1 /TAXON_ID=3005 /ORGANISM="Rhizosolenia setigera, Strain CCMP 1694" /LENGTH=365 /DNA_ID=CAMNT_0020636099 /DNA_START=79 /DNA_END=1176 /DNA_ORIENTATION=+